MKLLLLHGAGIVSSRKKLTDLKKDFDPNNTLVFAEGTSIEDIKNNLSSTSLFSTSRLVILENPPDDIANYLPATNYQLIFWFNHEVDTKKYPNAQVLFFPESKEISIFPFLDFLVTGNKSAYLELNKLEKGDLDISYLISMIFYLLRNLVSTPKNAKEFIKKKNEKMRGNFSRERITKLYQSILTLDFKLKKGLMEYPQATISLVNLFTHQL